MIVIFGSAGVLGTSISELLLEKFQRPLLMTANDSLADVAIYEEKYPGKVIIQKCDVSNPNDIRQVFANIDSLGVKISGIVNNFAFTFSDGGEHNFSAQTEEVRKVFDVNYFGLASVLEATVIWATKNKVSNLRVVNILSNSLKTLNASNSHYIASKSAAEMLTRYYAKHYSGYLSVNCVAPGLMRSRLTAERFDDHEQKVINGTPLGRLASPEEIAELVTYFVLSSPLSVCGQTIFVDGGRTL